MTTSSALTRARELIRQADDQLLMAISNPFNHPDKHETAAVEALMLAAKHLGRILVERDEIDGRLYIAGTTDPVEFEQVPA